MTHTESPDIARFALPEGAAWEYHQSTDFKYTDVAPYAIVEGITTMRTFTRVEHVICAAVRPPRRGGPMTDPALETQRAMAGEPRIFFAPIEEKLRIKGFNGRIMDGRVAILPFDRDLALAHSYKLSPQKLQADRRGFTVWYQGVLASGNKTFGEILLGTTYFTKTTQGTTFEGTDAVVRTMGKISRQSTLESLVSERVRSSSQSPYLPISGRTARAFRRGMTE